VLRKIAATLRDILQFLTKACHAIKDGVLWFINVPSRIAHAIANFFRGIGHAIADFFRNVGQFIVGVGKTLLRAVYLAGMGILWFLILLIVVRLLVYLIPKAYRAYRAYMLRRREAEANRICERYARESREGVARAGAEGAERPRQEQRAWGSNTREANDWERERDRDRDRDRERLRREAEARQQRERDSRRREQDHQRRRDEVLEEARANKRLKAAFESWKVYRERVLDVKKTMTKFPEPYAHFDCTDAACKQRKRRLQLCQHGIEKLYRAAGGDLEQLLKDERRTWHPDRFSACPADSGRDIYLKATELFQVIDGLYNRL
jgi:hypothetical protein